VAEALKLLVTLLLLLCVAEALKLLLTEVVEEGETLLLSVTVELLLGVRLPEPQAVPEALPAALGPATEALGLTEAVLQPLLLPELLWLAVPLAEKEELTVLEELWLREVLWLPEGVPLALVQELPELLRLLLGEAV
jgi:hypothetical protein